MVICTVSMDFHLGKYSTAEVIIVENTNTSPNNTENNRLGKELNADEVMKHGLLRIDAPAREHVERSAASAQKTLPAFMRPEQSFWFARKRSPPRGRDQRESQPQFAELVYKNTQASIGLIQTLSGVNRSKRRFGSMRTMSRT